MKLYEPLNTLKPVAEDVWVVDGPIVKMSYLLGSLPFPTRMVVVRLANEELFVWSPIQLDESLRGQIDSLGQVRHLISPNKLHYASIEQWKRAYPAATSWASPGVRDRASSQGIEVSFDRDLGDEAEEAWSGDLDQLIFGGSHVIEEVVFFHRKSQTMILADLIENFEPEKVERFYGLLVRLAGTAHPDGKTPLDLRATFLGNKEKARASVHRMLAWEPEQVIMAHGLPYAKRGTSELRRAFRWV